MATADHVKALIRSHAQGDEERFYAIAMQVAAQAARNGQSKFAQDLRELIDEAKVRCKGNSAGAQTKPVRSAHMGGELARLLSQSHPETRLADMALDEGVRSRIERVLLEQRQRGRIKEHGFHPLRKILLLGPPGTGKTMTAAALAGELGLPLLAVQLDGLITKFLGETAAKLRLIFDAIRETRAVYFFDEFDALGSERATKGEVGEIRRVLNSFLQFLEQDESDSLIISATNHPALLDRALFRRFDIVIEYALPSRDIAEHVMKARLSMLDTSKIDWLQVVAGTDGLSHADLARACEDAAKKAILALRTQVETNELVEALRERGASRG